MKYTIKNFNEIAVDGIIPATNDFGTVEEQTTVNTAITNLYTVNPLTTLLSEVVGLKMEYWSEYKNGIQWLQSNIPTPVAEYAYMHYRCLALYILSKQVNSLDNLKKTLAILLGYPFTLAKGVVRVTNKTDSIEVEQFAFRDIIPNGVEPTFIYSLPITYNINCKTGDVLSEYQTLIGGLEVYEYYKDTSWVSTYDPNNVIGLINSSSDEFTLNKNRIIAIWNKISTKYNFKFVQEYANKILSKNVITLFKQS
jgi:hypothetical protein